MTRSSPEEPTRINVTTGCKNLCGLFLRLIYTPLLVACVLFVIAKRCCMLIVHVALSNPVYIVIYERVREFSVWADSVLGHFGQTMKSCRNLICSHFNANMLKSTKDFIKKTTNMVQHATVNRHEHMIFVIISKQIKSLSTFSIKYKCFKVINNYNSN